MHGFGLQRFSTPWLQVESWLSFSTRTGGLGACPENKRLWLLTQM